MQSIYLAGIHPGPEDPLPVRVAHVAGQFGGAITVELTRLALELAPAQAERLLKLVLEIDHEAAGTAIDGEAEQWRRLVAVLPALLEHGRDALAGFADHPCPVCPTAAADTATQRPA